MRPLMITVALLLTMPVSAGAISVTGPTPASVVGHATGPLVSDGRRWAAWPERTRLRVLDTRTGHRQSPSGWRCGRTLPLRGVMAMASNGSVLLNCSSDEWLQRPYVWRPGRRRVTRLRGARETDEISRIGRHWAFGYDVEDPYERDSPTVLINLRTGRRISSWDEPCYDLDSRRVRERPDRECSDDDDRVGRWRLPTGYARERGYRWVVRLFRGNRLIKRLWRGSCENVDCGTRLSPTAATWVERHGGGRADVGLYELRTRTTARWTVHGLRRLVGYSPPTRVTAVHTRTQVLIAAARRDGDHVVFAVRRP